MKLIARLLSYCNNFVLCKIVYVLLRAWQKIHRSLSSLNLTSKPLPHYSRFAEYPYIR